MATTNPPRKEQTKRCDACGATIAFMKTAAGANQPVDVEYKEMVLDKTGDLYITTDEGLTLRGRELSDLDRENQLLVPFIRRGRVSHFRTCTDPQRFSKKK